MPVHLRDTYFEHTVRVDIDHAIAKLVTDEQVTNGGRSELENELGDAAKWFEHARTDPPDVTFELRVGDAFESHPTDDEAREAALEYAREKFDGVGSAFDVDRLTFVEVVDPADEHGEPEDGTDTDTGNGTDSVTDTDTTPDEPEQEPESELENTLAAAMGG